jgi:UDP-2,4-diacetamido-2,4,6-trideoxy-beta-L-altropyranose hydrolase
VNRALLVFDDGPGAGMGHRRRMAALATAMSRLGVRPELVPADDGHVKADVVVVDSYRHRADERGRFEARVLAGIDDLGRDLACDVVVDPNPGASATPHHAARRVLVGPAYALIDPEIARLATRPVADEVATALVASGAHDPRQAGRQMAVALAGLLPAVEVRLAVGPWTELSPADRVVTVRTEAGLGSALADADLVVTAAGVTLIEALALGRPTVAVVLADNQVQAARGVEEVGAALRADLNEAPGVAATLAHDVARRRSLAAAARATVDGRGALRVARALLELAA